MWKNLSCPSEVAFSEGRSTFTLTSCSPLNSAVLPFLFLVVVCLVVSSESHLIHQLNDFDSRVVQVRGTPEPNFEGGLKPGWMAGPEGSGQWHQGLIIPYPWSVLQGRHWAPSCAPASLMVWRVGCAFCSFADDTEMGGAPEVVLPSRWPQKSWRNGLAAASCRALPQGRNSHWDWLGSSLAEKAVGVLVTWQLLYFEFCLPHVKSELRDLLRDCRAVYVPPILRTVAALPGTGDVC